MQSQVTKQVHEHTIVTSAIGGLIVAVVLALALSQTVELPGFSSESVNSVRPSTVAYSQEGMGEGFVGSGGNADRLAVQSEVNTSLPPEAGEGFVDSVNVALVPIELPNYYSPNQGEGLVDTVNAALLPASIPDYFSPHQGEGMVDSINGQLNGIASTAQDDLPDYFSPNQGEGLLDQSN